MAHDAGALPPLRLRIAAAARAAHVPHYLVEKDYALSYLLAGIAATRELADLLVFKGGTCLRKAYFAGYRFSEDLDFTAREPVAAEALLAALEMAVARMVTGLQRHGSFAAIVAAERHRDPHPRGQLAFRVRVRFPWMRTPDCSLKVEVALGEPLLAAPAIRALIHEFPGETLDATLAAYTLEEIAAEKLRAFLQARQHRRERGWVRSRPRDLYDLWYLRLRAGVPIAWDQVGTLLSAKAAAYGLAYSDAADFLDAALLETLRRDWHTHLARLAVQPVPFEEALATVRGLLHDIAP